MPSFHGLFEWDEWDLSGDQNIFYDIVITKNLSESIKVGDTFECCFWFEPTLTLTFSNEGHDEVIGLKLVPS